MMLPDEGGIGGGGGGGSGSDGQIVVVIAVVSGELYFLHEGAWKSESGFGTTGGGGGGCGIETPGCGCINTGL